MKKTIIQLKKCFVFVALLFYFIFSSCNEQPTEIGIEFLQDSISMASIFNTDSVIVNVNSYHYNSPQERNTGALLVGNTDEFKSIGLIRFNVPVNKTNIKAEDITECTINFKLNDYSVGNKMLSFKVREVCCDWDIETDIDDVMNGSLFKNETIVDWAGDIQPDDTSFSIVLPFSTDLLVKWLDMIGDGQNIHDTNIIWGIGIVPDEISDVIASFKALANETITLGTFIDVKYKIYTDTSEVIDSMKIYSAEEVSFVKDKKNNVKNNSITLRGGTRIHTKFSFDLSDIPKLASISNADLVLFLDTDFLDLENNPPPDTLFLNYFGDNKERIHNSMITITGQYDSVSKCYIFKDRLAAAMNYFVRRNGGLGELVLTYHNTNKEMNNIELLNFLYDSNDKNKHIKLKIYYAKI